MSSDILNKKKKNIVLPYIDWNIIPTGVTIDNVHPYWSSTGVKIVQLSVVKS
jgi:hypothetical protein